jgi:hypothetical protein
MIIAHFLIKINLNKWTLAYARKFIQKLDEPFNKMPNFNTLELKKIITLKL